jgi:hypothetical protein
MTGVASLNSESDSPTYPGLCMGPEEGNLRFLGHPIEINGKILILIYTVITILTMITIFTNDRKTDQA